jgi:NDP-sugar pyrophosphorylase family protein
MKIAIILAGGLSSRFGGGIPKQLYPVTQDKSMLTVQIEWLKSQGIENIILGLTDRIVQDFSHLIPRGDETIFHAITKYEQGTGGCLKNCILWSNFLFSRPEKLYVMNVDDFIFSSSYKIKDIQLPEDKLATLILSRPELPFSSITTQADGQVINYVRNPVLNKLVSIGHYVINRNITDIISPSCQFEEDVLTPLATQGKLFSHVLNGKWITVNDQKQLKILTEELNGRH